MNNSIKAEEKEPEQLSMFDESRVLESSGEIIELPDKSNEDDEAA